MRFLPHFASNGETTLPLDWTYCYMLLPNDEQDAIRSASVMDEERKAIQLGLQKDYTPTGRFVLKHCKTQHVHGLSAGQVFYQMILNTIRSGEPEFRKSVYAVAEETFSGKYCSTSFRNGEKGHCRWKSTSA